MLMKGLHKSLLFPDALRDRNSHRILAWNFK